MRHSVLRVSLLVAAAVALAALRPESPVPPDPPRSPGSALPLAPETWQPLRETLDEALQTRLLAALIERPRRARLVQRGRLAVALVDMADPKNPRLAAVNGDQMIYAASLPKIAILLAAFENLEQGRLVESSAVVRDMEAMIRRSDNRAATRMIERIGLERIDEVLMADRYRLFDPEHGGGLWVGRAYARGGRHVPDPVAGLSHGATALQVARFYYLLAHGRLVSRERSTQMLGFLSNPGIRTKFVQSLQESARLGLVYRKSGTWKNWHSDSALVWEEGWRRYILVALAEDRQGGRILRELISLAEGLLRPRAQRPAPASSTVRP